MTRNWGTTARDVAVVQEEKHGEHSEKTVVF